MFNQNFRKKKRLRSQTNEDKRRDEQTFVVWYTRFFTAPIYLVGALLAKVLGDDGMYSF